MTYGEQFRSAMKCTTVQEANAWLKKEVERYVAESGKERMEAEAIIRSNLGYMAGYYDPEAAIKVYKLFGASHPIFGHPDYWKNLSPEDCIRIGKAQAGKDSSK